MILKVIILVVFALPLHSLNAAEAPLQPTQESEIPLSLNADHNKEIKKFQKYDLDHPEKFLELLHKKLKKDKNLFQYLKNLRLFATRLLVQAILAQAAADHFYLASYSQKLKDSFNAINDEIESYEAKPDIFIFTTQNDEQFEQMLLYSEIVSEKKLYSPEQMQTIYRWIIDPTKGKHLNLFGQTKKLAQEIKLVNQLNTQNKNKFYILQDALYATDYDRDYYDDADIIRENEIYLFQLFFDFERANKKISQARDKGIKARKLALIFQEYADEQMPLLNIYAHVYPYYQKLYAIIYNELIATRNELIRKDPKRIKELSAMTNSFPEMKEEAVPKKLPQEIAAFIPPSQTFTLPSLDNELAKARIEWQADQKIKAQQEEIKKQEAQAKEATKKIKESPLDGSYIRANDETQGSITIHNPKNNTTEVIFKTDKPNQIKKIPALKYTNWVKMWFENPREALEKQGYTKVGNPKYDTPENRWMPVVRHTFSPLVDDFILKWGTQSEINSRRMPGKKDILITLPGKIIHNDPAKKFSQTGVYTYIIDSGNGQWYHRMFTPEDSKQLIEDLVERGYFSPQMTGYYDVFFPPLGS